MKKDFSVIACILDRSGSMGSVVDDSIGGFNTFLTEQKGEVGEAKMTMVLFNHEYNVVHDFVDIKKVKKLTTKTYVPAGTTALLDAVGRTVDSLGDRLREMKENERPENVIVVILTDGQENSSSDYSRRAIKEKIEHQQDKYNWSFVFLGANQDAFAEAGAMGIRAQFTTGFMSDSYGTIGAYSTSSNAVKSIRRGKGKQVNLHDMMSDYESKRNDKDTDSSKVK